MQERNFDQEKIRELSEPLKQAILSAIRQKKAGIEIIFTEIIFTEPDVKAIVTHEVLNPQNEYHLSIRGSFNIQEAENFSLYLKKAFSVAYDEILSKPLAHYLGN